MFDDDFHHHKYGGICEDINHNAMKKFEFPNEFLPDESFALRSCEKYCSRKDACWGCSLFCDGLRCQWNAVSECKRQTTLDDDDKVYTSQKPSRSCMNIVNTIDLSNLFIKVFASQLHYLFYISLSGCHNQISV